MTYSIIQKSQLEGELRLDAEYYCISSSMKINSLTGEETTDFIQYGTSKDLNEEGNGYPVLRLNEFESYFVGKPEKYCDKISKSIFESLSLKKEDILISRTNGNPKLVGKAAMVMKDMDVAFASYLYRVRPNKNISSPCLTVFLNSSFGRKQIEKYLMPSIQSNFSPAKFREIQIPIFDLSFQKMIDELFDGSYLAYKESQSYYQHAEDLLLERLGLKDFDKGNDLFSIVQYSDVKTANRNDAEYFQPKYLRLEEKLKDNSQPLLKLIQNVPAKFDPTKEPNKEFKYVELANINSTNGLIDGYDTVLGKDAPSRAKRVLKAGDVIVSSVEGSLDKVALVSKEQEGYLASTGFFQFRSNKIAPEVLLILMKSVVMQWQLKQNCAGSILTAVPAESLNRMYIPVLSDVVAGRIVNFVTQSHEARKKSKELLEEAKRKVEEMIEKGE